MVASAPRKEIAHDEAPAAIEDHAYVPRGEWWSLCRICGLAEAAHNTTTIDSRAEMLAAYEPRNRRRGARARVGRYLIDEEEDD